MAESTTADERVRQLVPSDVASDCATWQDVVEAFALERGQRVSVWKSVDYTATVPREGPVAEADPSSLR